MKLGILVNTNRHLEDLTGLTRAAISKGHETIIFFMDEGVRLLHAGGISQLSEEKGVTMSYCDFSTQRIGLSHDGISDSINCGSQFDNASMNHEADRVIIL